MYRQQERARSFDAVAELYAASRPGYPESLFDDLLVLAAVPLGARVLEVGAGTGQATVALAARGLEVVALEPGRQMAALGRRRLEGFRRVTFVEERLEDWRPETASFDLVVAAEAWHWVDPDVGLRTAHECLNASGAVALIWNTAVTGPGSDPLHEALRRPYAEWAPHLADGVHLPEPGDADGRGDRLAESSLFRDLVVRRYPWQETFDSAAYLRQIGTYSDHILLPPDAAAGLFAAIADAIDNELRGEATLDRVAVLKVAKRA